MTKPIIVLAAMAMLLVAPATASARPVGVTHGLDYLHATQKADGSFSASDVHPTLWAILAIAGAQESPRQWGGAGDNPVAFLQTVDIESTAGAGLTPNRPEFYALTMLAFHAAGSDLLVGAAGSKSIDLLDKLNAFKTISGYWAPVHSATTDAVQTTAWAILAIEATGASPGADAQAWLVARQNVDGGFGPTPASSTPSTASTVADTALAALALRSLGYNPITSPELIKIALYLQGRQRDSGGFASSQTASRADADSTFWAIEGLWAAGQDPTDPAFLTKGSPFDFLSSLQRKSGGVKQHAGATVSLGSTIKAIIAFAGKSRSTGWPLLPIVLDNEYHMLFKPRFRSFAPSGSPVFHTSTVTAVARYIDLPNKDHEYGTGINVSAVRVLLDGNARTKSARIGATSLSIKFVGLSNGTHKVTVKLVDRAGNATTSSRSFKVSVTQPTGGGGTGGGGTGGGGTGGGGTGGGGTKPRPTPTATTFPSPSPTPTASSSPTSSATPYYPPGTSPAPTSALYPGGATPGPYATPLMGGSPSPVSSISGMATGSTGGGKGDVLAPIVGGTLAALVPIGIVASILVHKRRMSRLASEISGEPTADGTPDDVEAGPSAEEPA